VDTHLEVWRELSWTGDGPNECRVTDQLLAVYDNPRAVECPADMIVAGERSVPLRDRPACAGGGCGEAAAAHILRQAQSTFGAVVQSGN
jgi:hypothetical protein